MPANIMTKKLEIVKRIRERTYQVNGINLYNAINNSFKASFHVLLALVEILWRDDIGNAVHLIRALLGSWLYEKLFNISVHLCSSLPCSGSRAAS